MHNMTDTLIMLRDVTKDYGKHRIIDHIDLDIKKGQSIALLGHNGSGKSTLLKMIGGLTRISSGEVRYSSDLKFNYIPEHFPKMHLTVKQYIKHMGLIEGLSSKAIKEKSQEFFKAFFYGIDDRYAYETFIKGNITKSWGYSGYHVKA